VTLDRELDLGDLALELMSGHWTIVSEGTEGRHRWYAASRVQPVAKKPRALSTREREVLTLALGGHSNKHIAYTLGIGTSAVSTLLGRARRKLAGRIPEELLSSLLGAFRVTRMR
jgi:DNA-binding CsgD family transcriptional regulator